MKSFFIRFIYMKGFYEKGNIGCIFLKKDSFDHLNSKIFPSTKNNTESRFQAVKYGIKPNILWFSFYIR